MIVVDTNIIAYLFIAGSKTALAQQLFQQDADWIVPSLWRHEFLNVLATLVQHGGGNPDDALAIWRQSIQMLTKQEREPNLPLALQLATQFSISAYDAQFVTLAKAAAVPLITEDHKLLTLFPEQAVSMSDFLAR